MAFPIRVCADMGGTAEQSKVNLEIPFAGRPSMPELAQKIKEVFDYEANCMQPPSVPPRPFQIKKLQVYNDERNVWEDLVRTEQLYPQSQLYCFQPNVADRQQGLPDPRPPRHPMAQATYGAASSPYPQQHQHMSTGPASYNPQNSMGVLNRLNERPHVDQHEKVRIVFEELDTNAKSFLDYGDLERGFKQRALHFAVNTIGELFHKADINRDNRITFEEWTTWCKVYPNTLDAMYYRGKNTSEESQIHAMIKEVQDLNGADQLAAELIHEMVKRSTNPAQLAHTVKSLNNYVAPAAQALQADPSRDVRPDMQRALEDLSRNVQHRERQLPEFESQLRTAQERRHVLEQQEMNLLEQEIRLERTRDQMRAQEAKYLEAESMFNTKATETGSPRRAAQRFISASVQ